MYESLAQFSAGTAEHKSDGGERVLLFLPGRAHDEGHTSHNSTCSSGAQAPYPQIPYPAAHH